MFFNRKKNTTKKSVSFIKNNHDLLDELKEKGIMKIYFQKNGFWISFSVRSKPAGHPSNTVPIHLPWLSPILVRTKRLPIVLPVNNKRSS